MLGCSKARYGECTDHVYGGEEAVGRLDTECGFNIEPQVLHVPLTTVFVVVVLVVLLDSYVGEVHEGVVHVRYVGSVFSVTESSKAVHIFVDSQRAIGADEHVDAKVKLLAADEQGVLDVLGYDVGLLVRHLGPLALG